MEDLQDAIEDAQFINAMHEDAPKPSKRWKKLTKEELIAYEAHLKTKHRHATEIEGICGNCLGFYLFSIFVCDHGDSAYATFLQAVAYYRVAAPYRRLDLADAIVTDFLSFESPGVFSHTLPHNLTRTTPALTEPLLWNPYINDDSQCNVLNILGAPVEDALEHIRLMHQRGSGSDVQLELPDTLFDTLDHIVFAYLKEKYLMSFRDSACYDNYLNFMALSEHYVTEDDFSLYRVLGRGGFGVVNGCKRCQSGKLYAMKVMDRRRIKLKKAETLCINERNILAMVDSKFVVCLKYAFTTPTELYLILDLMIGGDLGFHLHRKGRFSRAEAKYYISRTVLGLKALHDVNVVYRDLKPDNILMDDVGRTRISDLGLAVRVPKNGLTGACGTRGYWAPEMLRRDAAGNRIRYNLSVDWFSLGCVLCEFLTGVCPFRSEIARSWGGSSKKDKEKAIDLATMEMEPVFDHDVYDEVTEDFCRKLLNKDGAARLGANGADEVMNHPYFSDVNWEEVKYEKHPAPFIPRRDLNMASQSEIGSFIDETTRRVELTTSDEEIFGRWNYVRQSAFLEEVVEFMKTERARGPFKFPNHGDSCCTIQ